MKVKIVVGNPGNVQCSVSLMMFNTGDRVLQLDCSHLFHIHGGGCAGVETWLLNHLTCPICRDNVVVIAQENFANGN